MILYKYFSPERVDVLEQLKIRLSQPATYNDPFEVNPVLISDMTEEQFYQIMKIEAERCVGGEAEKEAFRQAKFSDYIENEETITILIQKMLSSTAFALCLSEKSADLLMWAHYSLSHTGFILGFNTKHEFFKSNKGIYCLKAIDYRVDRPHSELTKLTLSDAYFTKSLAWEYEKEWRLFRKANEYCSVIGNDNNGLPIVLFDLPGDAIVEIILGCRMVPALESRIKKIVIDKLSHVKVRYARISQKHYELIIS